VVLDDLRALRLGDLTGPVRRGRIDDDDLVEERRSADHLPDRPTDDRADRLLLVQGGQDEADREPLLLLQLGEAPQVSELGVVEVRFAEPALDACRDGPRFLGRAVGRDERLGSGRELLERLPADRLAGLDDHDGCPRAGGDRLGHGAEEMRRAIRRRRRRRSHDHDVRPIGLLEDRGPDVGRLPQEWLRAAAHVLLHECHERVLGLGPNRESDSRRDDVERHEEGVVPLGDRVTEAQRELGVGPAADRHHDPLELAGAALLHDDDVAGRFAQDLVDRRREGRGEAVSPGRGLAAPAEDDEVGVELGRGLDDPLTGVAADPDDRVDRRALGNEVEDAL
jgi:hypothetical protein